jgi:hypothetical protein
MGSVRDRLRSQLLQTLSGTTTGARPGSMNWCTATTPTPSTNQPPEMGTG